MAEVAFRSAPQIMVPPGGALEPARQQEPARPSFSPTVPVGRPGVVESMVQTALRNNPELAVARNALANSQEFEKLFGSGLKLHWGVGQPTSNPTFSVFETKNYVRGIDPINIANFASIGLTWDAKEAPRRRIAKYDALLALSNLEAKQRAIVSDIQRTVAEGWRVEHEIEVAEAERRSYREQIGFLRPLTGGLVPSTPTEELVRLQEKLSSEVEPRLQGLYAARENGRHKLARLMGVSPDQLGALPALRRRSERASGDPRLGMRLFAGLPGTVTSYAPLPALNSPAVIRARLYDPTLKRNAVLPVFEGGFAVAGKKVDVRNLDRGRTRKMFDYHIQQAQAGNANSQRVLTRLSKIFPVAFASAALPSPDTRIASSGARLAITSPPTNWDGNALLNGLMALAATQSGVDALLIEGKMALPVRKNGEVLASSLKPEEFNNINFAKLHKTLVNDLIPNGQIGSPTARRIIIALRLKAELDLSKARGVLRIQMNPFSVLAFSGALGGAAQVGRGLGELLSWSGAFGGGTDRKREIQVARANLEQGILKLFSEEPDVESRQVRRDLADLSGREPGSRDAAWRTVRNSLITQAKIYGEIRAKVESGALTADEIDPDYRRTVWDAYRGLLSAILAMANQDLVNSVPTMLRLADVVGGVIDPKTLRVRPDGNFLDEMINPDASAKNLTRRLALPSLPRLS